MRNEARPLVSVVFTSYNHDRFVRKALESILNQTYENIEVIVVDDLSTDTSRNILLEYAHHPKVKLLLRDTNSGSYVKASNFGASFATGSLLLFAQCDDYADPTQIDKLVRALERHPNVGVAFSRSNLVDEHDNILSDDFAGREKAFREQCKNDTVIPKSDMIRYLSYSCVLPNLSAAIIRKELYHAVGGLSQEHLVLSDWGFWLDLATKADFYYLTEPLNFFRQHGRTIRSSVKIKTQILELYATFYDFLKRNNLSAAERFQLRKGAGAVWFAFCLENPRQCLRSFPKVAATIMSRFEPLGLMYFMLGVQKTVFEYISAKTNKQG